MGSPKNCTAQHQINHAIEANPSHRPPAPTHCLRSMTLLETTLTSRLPSPAGKMPLFWLQLIIFVVELDLFWQRWRQRFRCYLLSLGGSIHVWPAHTHHYHHGSRDQHEPGHHFSAPGGGRPWIAKPTGAMGAAALFGGAAFYAGM